MTDLDARYGRRPRGAGAEARGSRSRWIALVAGALTLGVVGFWILSTMFGGVADQSIRADVLRFSPQEDGSISFDFRLTAPTGRALACALEAQDDHQAVIGWDVIDVPAAEEPTRTLAASLRTVGEPTTVLVKECWPV